MITVIFGVITKKNKFFTKKIRILFVITKIFTVLRTRVSLYIYTISQNATFFAVISEFCSVDFKFFVVISEFCSVDFGVI